MKKLFLSYCIVTAIIALVTTMMQTFPASIVIDWIAMGDQFYIKLAFLITWMLMLLPPVLLLFIFNQVVHGNKVPANLDGMSGIIIDRRSALLDALWPFDILINGERMQKVGNGKKVFIELRPGSYILQLKTGNRLSLEKEIVVEASKIHTYNVSINPEVKGKLIPMKENYILIN